MTSPSASQVKAHSLWPQTTSLARGDPTSPSWRQLGKHTSAHQPIEKGGQRTVRPTRVRAALPPPCTIALYQDQDTRNSLRPRPPTHPNSSERLTQNQASGSIACAQ
eukprot:scaffold778_cov122-Isochrysis_galbana.AAC.2